MCLGSAMSQREEWQQLGLDPSKVRIQEEEQLNETWQSEEPERGAV